LADTTKNEALRFGAASLSLGAIGAWGSENFFWSGPQADFSVLQLPLLWLVYSLGTALALSAILLTGVKGWRALFLGGAMFGFAIEGAVAGTMFQAFPFQLVWTPLAWHALITSLCIFGLTRRTVVWPISKLMAGWIAVGLFGGVFAAYWPLERQTMPGLLETAFYLVGLGLVVPLASIALEKVSTVTLSPRWVHGIAPVLLTGYWLVHVVTTLSPFVLALPACLLLTAAAMARLGKGPAAITFEPSPKPLRHWLFLLAPATTTLIAYCAWQTIGGLPTNIPVALLTSSAALALFAVLLFQAFRQR
jgi:hypothetical protein